MRKSIITFLAMIALAGSLFTACSKDSSSDTPSGNSIVGSVWWTESEIYMDDWYHGEYYFIIRRRVIRFVDEGYLEWFYIYSDPHPDWGYVDGANYGFPGWCFYDVWAGTNEPALIGYTYYIMDNKLYFENHIGAIDGDQIRLGGKVYHRK